jgi:purine-nucleoside phosphorylase
MPVRIQQSVDCIRRQWPVVPRVGIILGTGLAHAVTQFDVRERIAYERIPGFVPSTALGHPGRLVCGSLSGVPAVALNGRCHFYEGYSWREIVFPVEVLHALGVRLLIVTNASGGLNDQFRGGEIMVVMDHLNFLPCGAPTVPGSHRRQRASGLAASEQRAGWCYDRRLIELALEVARRENFVAHQGVYVAVTGPNYETRAEYRMFRQFGGDAVGMSTVPEVLTAAQRQMRVLALSMVTNVATPDAPHKVDAHEVVAMAARAEPNLAKIVQGVVRAALS